jgi:hypothetical protein
MSEEKKECPHCGGKLSKWGTPIDSTWDVDYFLVCFNDECPYFLRGWEWMQEKFNVKASYRYRLHPVTFKEGSLPVGSKNALKGDIIEDGENNDDR